MKRLWFSLLASVTVLWSGLAFASSHSAPVDPTFLGRMLWEVQHFTIHMSLTASAIFTTATSPAFGWAMLGSQTLCASMSPIVGFLFGSAWSALLTFMLAILAITAFVIWVSRLLWRIVSVRLAKRQFNATYA